MKISFTTPAGLGHVNPMLPLVQAMVRRGHTALWALVVPVGRRSR